MDLTFLWGHTDDDAHNYNSDDNDDDYDDCNGNDNEDNDNEDKEQKGSENDLKMIWYGAQQSETIRFFFGSKMSQNSQKPFENDLKTN